MPKLLHSLFLVGDDGLAMDKPLPVEATLAYFNCIFYRIQGRWWSPDNEGILRNVVAENLIAILDKALPPKSEFEIYYQKLQGDHK